MNPPRNIFKFIALAAIAILAIGLAAQREARIKAEAEGVALDKQLETLRSIADENAKLSNLVAGAYAARPLPEDESHELLRLRGEVSALRRQMADLGNVLNENRQVHAAPDRSSPDRDAPIVKTVSSWPRDSWTFAGYASPEAALESSLWAANNGDLKSVLDSVTGQFRENIEKDLAGKSETEVVTRIMDEVTGMQSVSVLGRVVQPDGTIQITAMFEGRHESNVRKLILQKVGNDWKIASGQ